MKIARLLIATLLAGVVSSGASATVYNRILHSDQHLLPGDSLVSYDGRYELIMKVDGSIAIRKTGGTAEFWNPGKFGQELVFQYDGNLVLYDLGRQHALWTVDKGVFTPSIYTLEIDTTGGLNATTAAGKSIWYVPGEAQPAPPHPPCPGGAAPQPYPACANAGTPYQWNLPIPACSPAEAAQLARASGLTPGACR